MRKFGGMIVDEEYVRQLREEYKAHKHLYSVTFEKWMTANTGWTHEEFIQWVANGRLPDDTKSRD